jgi:peptidoglycan/xylan/chitin deacetylase (PgdA/CDA1 family)
MRISVGGRSIELSRQGAGRFLRRSRRRLLGARRLGLILNYHRVRDTPGRDVCSVSPSRLHEHLQVVARHFCVLGLSQALAQAEEPTEPGNRPWVALTFDDGYADNLEAALPILEAHAAPATFFISSGAVLNQEEFWWDQIRDVEAAKRHKERFKRMDLEQRQRELRRLCPTPGPVRPDYRPLSVDEVRRLGSHPLAEIGSHTVHHASLPCLAATAQSLEIEQDKRALEQMLGRAVAWFAYPYGAFNDAVRERVQAAGFKGAFTVEPEPVEPGRNRFSMPRFHVENWSERDFEQRLLSWWRHW